MAKLEESIGRTMLQEGVSMIGREDVQERCKARNVLWYGDGGGDRKMEKKMEVS